VSALDSLIRLHRWQLDERRRDLATLEDLAAKLVEERARLDIEDMRERAAAAASPEAAFGYGADARGLIARRRKLEGSRIETAQRIVEAREALAAAFQEMKRYEIAAASRVRQQQQQQARRQQRVLDDLGIDAFRSKSTGDS
jgi:flagellar protein FliJ